MNSKFTVDLDQLDQIVTRLSGLASFLNDHFDQLDHKVSTLNNGSWESAAASAYRDAHAQWAASAREFTQGVADISDAAKKAHARYTSAIDTNHRMLQSGQP